MPDTEVKARVTELPESRVRVEAEVPAAEVERRLSQAARQLGEQLRVPGFRRGKVPPPVVIRRVGRDAVLDEAVRESLGRWYADALDVAGIHPVGSPDLNVGDLPAEGEPLTFTVEIGVRPTAQLGPYKGLEVGRREPVADPAAVDAEIEALRNRLAKVETADHPAQEGDFLVLDYSGDLEGESFPGGEGRDQLIELGSGRLIPGFEDQLVGLRAGEDKEFPIVFPDDYGAPDLAGRQATFSVHVSDVKEKILPPVDDALAADAAGFDSLDELREDITVRVKEADEEAVARDFREAALDAAVAGATVEIPDELTHARAHELWEQTVSTLARQGISREVYLRMTGRPEEEIVHEAIPEAETALRREAVLAAVVEAEGIEPSEEELLETLQDAAEHGQVTPAKMLERLRKLGRLDALKEELAVRRALELLAEEATPVPLAPEPEQDGGGDEPAPAAGPKLWTPGS